MRHKSCPDCGPLPKSHFEKYVESFAEYILPGLNEKWTNLGERIFVRILSVLGILEKTKNIPLEKISLRTGVFIAEGRKRGWDFWAHKGPAGYLNVFEMQTGGERYLFEGLPLERLKRCQVPSKKAPDTFIDDKAAVKKILIANNIPAPEGKSFWFFNREKAVKYAMTLGFSLVVKPRSGSMSHHVTIDIKDKTELRLAIKRALRYEPAFIIEKYLSGTHVFRATVVGKKQVACVQRIPANIVGDGIHSISQLVAIKNSSPNRGLPRQKDTTLYKLVINETSRRLLEKQDFSFDDVILAGQRVFLQEKVILDLGADLVEITPRVHPENVALFKKIAEIFGANLVGIDFLCKDISQSWRSQKCGIIELNSLPYIDMHHFPSQGEPVNVAGWICDVVEANLRKRYPTPLSRALL